MPAPVGLGTAGLELAGVGVAGECPAALVQEGVVVAAHQDEVVEGGGSAVVSGDYVVDVAPLPGPVTAVELAVVVSEADGSPLVWCDVGCW